MPRVSEVAGSYSVPEENGLFCVQGNWGMSLRQRKSHCNHAG